MPPTRVQKRATTHVHTPRVFMRSVEKLTRCRGSGGRTLQFTFPSKTGGSRKSATEFVSPGDVPDFEGESAWFELEKVERGNGRSWPWWRAVRQVEPPADA